MKKRIFIIALICLISAVGFARYNIYQRAVNIADMDTSAASDTVFTLGLTDTSAGLAAIPDFIDIAIQVNDSAFIESPVNTANIDIWGLIADTNWVYISNYDTTSRYGIDIQQVENIGYDKIRFIISSNTGWVKIWYSLKYDR